jgi:prephenate dehydrogenase
MPVASRSGFTAIIGLGLIGGSIARELAALGVRVLA